jgi:hypothetical protein
MPTQPHTNMCDAQYRAIKLAEKQAWLKSVSKRKY